MHSIGPGGAYTTFAYKFQREPPFRVRAVSRPLPLQGGQASFASGLLLHEAQNKVVVSYGNNDVEPRALVMSTANLESLFDSCVVDEWVDVGCDAGCAAAFTVGVFLFLLLLGLGGFAYYRFLTRSPVAARPARA